MIIPKQRELLNRHFHQRFEKVITELRSEYPAKMPKPSASGTALANAKADLKKKETYLFYAVKFINRGKEPRVKSVDLVLRDWFVFDDQKKRRRNDKKSKKRAQVQYPKNPQDSDYDYRLQHLLSANPEWPVFTVEIVGKTDNYQDALKKIMKLNKVNTVLTMSSDADEDEAAQLEVEKLRRSELLNRAKEFSNKISSSTSNSKHQKTGNSKDSNHATMTAKTNAPPKTRHPKGSLSLLADSSLAVKAAKQRIAGSTLTNQVGRELTQNSSQLSKVHSSDVMNSENSLDETTKKLMNKSSLVKKCSTQQLCEEQKEKEDVTMPPYAGNTDSYSPKSPSDANITPDLNLGCQGNRKHEDFSNLPNTEDVTQIEIIDFSQIMMSIADVLKEMKNITKSVKDLAIELLKEFGTVKSMIGKISNGENIQNDFIDDKEALSKGFDYTIPFTRSKYFEEFDAELATNGELVGIVKSLLKSELDKDSISKSLVKMIRMFMKKRAASKWTAVKKVSKKKVFKKTNFYKIAEGIIRKSKKNETIEDKTFRTALSNVLTNVHGWKEEVNRLDEVESSSDESDSSEGEKDPLGVNCKNEDQDSSDNSSVPLLENTSSGDESDESETPKSNSVSAKITNNRVFNNEVYENYDSKDTKNDDSYSD